MPKSSKFASKYRKNSTRDKFASRLRGYALNLCGQGLLVAALLLCQTNLRAAARRFLARFSALLKLFLRLILLSIGTKNQNKCKIRVAVSAVTGPQSNFRIARRKIKRKNSSFWFAIGKNAKSAHIRAL